jgi:branched-chain amino acid transport system substrate-binding protein
MQCSRSNGRGIILHQADISRINVSATLEEHAFMIERPISTGILKIAFALSTYGVLSWSALSAAAENGPITIGVVLPLTGGAAHWGIPPRNAAEMAVDEINSAGGIGGRKLALMVEDDRCQPADGVSAFDKITAAANPPVVLGAVCSSVTLAIAPLAEARKTALISPASTTPKLTDAGDFIFRVIPSGTLRAKVFAEYLYNERGLRKLAVLYINNEGGIGGASSFKAQFTRLGGTIVLEETYPQGATDIRAPLTKIKAANVDGVMVGSYPPDTVLVLQQARELALQQPLFLTTEAVQNLEVLREARDAANGVVYILAAPAVGEAPERFAAAYEAKFGKKPELFAAEGYDIVRLIAQAIAATNGTPLSGSNIRDFLYQVRNYAGASGAITFDKNGDVIKPFAIMTIEAGSPKTILVKQPGMP